MFVGQTTVVIGGKVGSCRDTYVNPSAISKFFSRKSHRDYDNTIQIGHIVDFFLHGHTSSTYHFPAIDDIESSIEHKDSLYKSGWAKEVLPDELNKRAAKLVADPIFKKADAIGETTPSLGIHNAALTNSKYNVRTVISYDSAFHMSKDSHFDMCLRYLTGREKRQTDAIAAICNAIRELPKLKKKGVQIIVVQNSLSWLSRATMEDSKDGRLAAAKERVMMEEYREKASHRVTT